MKKILSYILLSVITVFFSAPLFALHNPAAENNDTTIYRVVDRQPEFPGGYAALKSYIADHLQYPQTAIKRKAQGRVMTTFVIEKDGSISNISVSQSPDESLSNEAIRIIQSFPRWQPGIQNGNPARVELIFPILFRPE